MDPAGAGPPDRRRFVRRFFFWRRCCANFCRVFCQFQDI